MTREEYNKNSADVLAELSAEKPDTGKISELLSTMRDGFNEEVTKTETATKESGELKSANESLQAANMALFLKSGEILKKSEEKSLDNLSENKKPDFSTLFDENGELK